MTETLQRLNSTLNGYVWGWPLIVLLMGTGLLLTVLTGAVQFRRLGFALRQVLGRITRHGGGKGDVRPFQAVATAWNGRTSPFPPPRCAILPSTSCNANPRRRNWTAPVTMVSRSPVPLERTASNFKQRLQALRP